MYQSLHKFIIIQSIFSQILINLKKHHKKLLTTIHNLKKQKSIIKNLIKKKTKIP